MTCRSASSRSATSRRSATRRARWARSPAPRPTISANPQLPDGPAEEMRQCVVATGRHVLIVEDDHVTALVISEYLRAHGYRTSVARSGLEAIAMFLLDVPDLALVDVQLPRKDGFQV